MKYSKLYLIIVLLILSGKLFSQSLKPADLIGFWEEHPSLTKFEFIDDSSAFMVGGHEGSKLKYSLKNENGQNLLTNLNIDQDDSLYLFFEIIKIDRDTLKFENIKFRWFHSNKKSWEEIDNKRYTTIYTRVVSD